ncbi:MAG: DNA-packaging protein [Clostridiales bacterium]|nr:DNA-packaging protein [Clostridiales bacterium]
MAGRPTKYTKEKLKDIQATLERYIENTEIPILSEFAYQNKIPRQKLYEFEILNDTIKTLIDKKEAQLERKALKNEINNTMAIFSLKQLGWKDRQEHEVSGKDGEPIEVTWQK